jgi:hypothetical protein
MVTCGVLFEVRTEFLNIIYTSFGFKGLMSDSFILIVSISGSRIRVSCLDRIGHSLRQWNKYVNK